MQEFFSPDSVSVKICGLMEELHVDVAVGAGADAIGFMFVEESPRCVSRDEAHQMVLQLPDSVIPVAVVKDYPTLEDFSDWPGILQLCGSESYDAVQSAPCPVIKAFKWDASVYDVWRETDVDGILIDGSLGGMGVTLDANDVVQHLGSDRDRLVLAGGLDASNVTRMIDLFKPAVVDVSSGVEITRGEKCPEKICEFINIVKSM